MKLILGFHFLQSFVIPVNVRVTDINDNAPEWINAPYSLPLSEVTVPGTRSDQNSYIEEFKMISVFFIFSS